MYLSSSLQKDRTNTPQKWISLISLTKVSKCNAMFSATQNPHKHLGISLFPGIVGYRFPDPPKPKKTRDYVGCSLLSWSPGPNLYALFLSGTRSNMYISGRKIYTLYSKTSEGGTACCLLLSTLILLHRCLSSWGILKYTSPGPPKSTDIQGHVFSSFGSQSSSPIPHVFLLLSDIKFKIQLRGNHLYSIHQRSADDTNVLSASLYKDPSTIVPFFLGSSKEKFSGPPKYTKARVMCFACSSLKITIAKVHVSVCLAGRTIKYKYLEMATWRMSAVCPLLRNIRDVSPCLSLSCMRTRQVYIWACRNHITAGSCLCPVLKRPRQPHMRSFFSEMLQISLPLRDRRPKILPLMAMSPSPFKRFLPLPHVSYAGVLKTTLYVSARENWQFFAQISLALLPLSRNLSTSTLMRLLSQKKKGIQQTDGVVCQKKLRIVVCRRKAYIPISTFPSGHPKTTSWDSDVFCSLLSKMHIPLSSMKVHG